MAKALIEKNLSDPGFIKKLREGDRASIEQLVHVYTEHLYRGALGLGFGDDEARELVQSVWLTLIQVIPKFEGRSHIRTFLFGILYNKAAEQRRQVYKHGSIDPIDEILEKRFDNKGHWIKPPIDPEAFLATAEITKFIKDCLDDLPLTQRMAFCLKEIDDHKSQDICNILNISNTNLGVILYRARNRLRECIERKSNGSALDVGQK